MKFGTANVTALKVGTVNASRAYLGSTLVWEAGGGGGGSGIITATIANVSGATFDVPLPDERAAGDLLLLITGSKQGNVPIAATGYDSHASFVGGGPGRGDLGILYRELDGSESTPLTITNTGSVARVVAVVLIRGQDASPFNAKTETSDVIFDATAVVNSVTTTAENCIVLNVIETGSAIAITLNGGVTPLVASSVPTTGPSMAVGYLVVETAGATGALNGALSPNERSLGLLTAVALA